MRLQPHSSLVLLHRLPVLVTITLLTALLLYKSISTELSVLISPDLLASYDPSWSTLFCPAPISIPGANFCPIAKDTFVETSAYDLPKLVKRNIVISDAGTCAWHNEGEDDLGVLEGIVDTWRTAGLRVAVLEHAGFHEGDGFRWGFEQVLELGMDYTIPPTPYSDGTFAKDVNNGEFDVVFHISCDHAFWNWPRNDMAFEAMKNSKELEVVCMLHQLENLNDEERESWEVVADQERLTYLTLSKHVKNYLRSEVLKWSHSLNKQTWGNVYVEEFIPIFPIDASRLSDSEFVNVAEFFPRHSGRTPSRFAVLGNIQPWRRNYNSILDDLFQAVEADPASWGYLPLSSEPNSTYMSANDKSTPPVTLHFIGSLLPTVHLDVPAPLTNMVFIHSDLYYLDFYRLLGSMDLILPAFVGWTYLEKKLSSAIPAAIISRVPLLGSELLLNAYQFLREPAIILHKPGMREIEAIGLLRKGLDPYTANKPVFQDRSPLEAENSRSWNKELLTETKPLLPKCLLSSEQPVHSVRKVGQSHGPDGEPNFDPSSEWKQYHQNLYVANKGMMSDLLERLYQRIERRRLSGEA
uniref:Uncharacterized protein n=1 Tax=Kwoniella dejecticola CBS 10117 TaxID=1296121 RepID=A0A1A5ZV08_9TREE|nr:uncharacterized protein I303_08411 [Kwoniella dejecticola CBS 10117]OBR81640.1 hypothetical protein I303_08411 [Kwoniella dejecticola CBS 10117]